MVGRSDPRLWFVNAAAVPATSLPLAVLPPEATHHPGHCARTRNSYPLHDAEIPIVDMVDLQRPSRTRSRRRAPNATTVPLPHRPGQPSGRGCPGALRATKSSKMPGPQARCRRRAAEAALRPKARGALGRLRRPTREHLELLEGLSRPQHDDKGDECEGRIADVSSDLPAAFGWE